MLCFALPLTLSLCGGTCCHLGLKHKIANGKNVYFAKTMQIEQVANYKLFPDIAIDKIHS